MKLFLCLFFAAFIMAGCCCGSSDNKGCREDSIVAKINNYCLRASDFRDEARIAPSGKSEPADIEKAKEAALDEIITKKVLLQEAQKKNFDKDRDFRKEIERYWEQALLKLLMKNKIEEFSKKISPDIQGDLKQRLIQAALDRWIADLRKSAKVKIYKGNLDKVEMK